MKQTSLHIVFILLILPVAITSLLAQEGESNSWALIKQLAEDQYGPDQDLLNGKKYYYTYRSAEGTPFFEVHGDMLSDIRIKGKEYQEQKLRFDIYNQLLILDFTDLSGASGSIILRDDWVEFFTLGQLLFRKYPDKQGKLRFGQVVFEGEYSCIYFWEKEYIPELEDGKRYFSFSKEDRDAVIIHGGKTNTFKNKGSFLKCFPKEDRGKIKSFLRKENLKVHKVSDLKMEQLMQTINKELL